MKMSRFFAGSTQAARWFQRKYEAGQPWWFFSSWSSRCPGMVEASGYWLLYAFAAWAIFHALLGILLPDRYQASLELYYSSAVITCTVMVCHYLAYRFWPEVMRISDASSVSLPTRAIPEAAGVIGLVLRWGCLICVGIQLLLMIRFWQFNERMVAELVTLLLVGLVGDCLLAGAKRLKVSTVQNESLDWVEGVLGVVDYAAKMLIQIAPAIWVLLLGTALCAEILGRGPRVNMTIGGIFLFPVLCFFALLIFRAALQVLRALLKIIFGAAQRLQ